MATRKFKLILFAMGIAGAILLVYLCAWFAVWIEANWWPV